MKFIAGLLAGAVIGGIVAADHYGHIYRGDVTSGIICRVYGYETALIGFWYEAESVCVDLSDTVVERVLWDRLLASFSTEEHP